MDTQLAPWAAGRADAKAAQDILRRCVHCGFCTATCPTYQLTGDERDGPRGRIYLIKELLEGRETEASAQHHLDRCLTCRSCETTCPSGVQYGRLVDVGRSLLNERAPRPAWQRWRNGLLRNALLSPGFGLALWLGRLMRPVLPASIRAKVPQKRPVGAAVNDPAQWASRLPEDLQAGLSRRTVLLPGGCVQPLLSPSIDSAARRILADLKIATVSAPDAGCCGALRHHLDDTAGAHTQMRKNVDSWSAVLSQGKADAVLMTASGCGAVVAEYGHHLEGTDKAEAAARVGQALKDPIELLAPHAERLAKALAPRSAQWGPVVYHPPCTQQHGLKIKGAVESLLRQIGVDLRPVADSHLCCGSAGTYSILQPELSGQLRTRKLAALQASAPTAILSANIGCLTHLESGTDTPVMHWLEWLDQELTAAAAERADAHRKAALAA